METKLNDNEVREIAEMQSKINSYEVFIKTLFLMAKNGKELASPLFTEIRLEAEMNYLWKYVKQTKNIE